MAEIVVVSYSELDAYRQCPLKHELGYKLRYRKETTSDALNRGKLWHAVIEAHYKAIKIWWDGGKDMSVSFVLEVARQDVNKILDKARDEKNEQADLVQWMYEGYVEKYGIDERWRPLALEFAFQLPLPNEKGRPSRYHMKGKIDAIMRDMETGRLWVWDHKSGANLPSQMDLEIDDQFGGYTWAMRQLGHKVIGSMHNANRTTRNLADFPDYEGKSKPQTLEQRHSRTYLNRGDIELDAIALDAYNVARNAYPPKSMQLPLYSSPDPRQCGWKCDFKEAHLGMRTGIPAKEALEDRGFIQDFTRHN